MTPLYAVYARFYDQFHSQGNNPMPNLILPIKATYESVTRLATHSVVRQVLKRTGLSESVPIRFLGETGTDQQPGSDIHSTEQNIFEHHSKVKISVQEEYKDDAVINSPVREQDAPYVFEDTALGVLIKPIYSHTAMTISFEYRASTRVEVEAWRNDIKVRLADNRSGMLHELDYHYEVPQACLTTLAHLHELREAQAGYGEDLTTWFQKCFTKRTTVLTKMDGKSSLLVVAEKAIGIQGWFEFIEPNEAEKDSEGASWTVSFSYKFHYHKPVSVNFLYPLVVHNQLIDSRLFSKRRPYSLDDRPSLKSETTKSYSSISDLHRQPPDPMGGIRNPEWDDWVPNQVPNYTTSLSTWLLQVDRHDPTLILDMNDLGCHELVDLFKEFLTHEQPYVTRRGKSLIYFTLFRGNEPMDDKSIYMDEHLVLRTREPMNVRQTYHVRLGVVVELSLLDARAKEAMLKFGLAVLLIWQCLIPNLDVEYASSLLISGCRLPNRYLEWFYQMLRDQMVGHIGGRNNSPWTYDKNETYRSYYIEWPLVNILTIIAAKKGPQ
jgi:hypothetical protein